MKAANSPEAAPCTRARFRKHATDEVRSRDEVVRASGIKVE